MEGQEYTNLLVLVENLKYQVEQIEIAIKTSVPVQVIKGE